MADKGKGSQDSIGTTGKISVILPRTERGEEDKSGLPRPPKDK